MKMLPQGLMTFPTPLDGVAYGVHGELPDPAPRRLAWNRIICRIFMRPKIRSVEPKKPRGFDVEGYLESAGPARRVAKYRRGEVVFSQGDPGNDIRYIQRGAIKLSVLSRIGKEAVV